MLGQAMFDQCLHTLSFDCKPKKKPRHSGSVPKVHITVNIAPPTPGTEAAMATYTVNTKTHQVTETISQGRSTLSTPSGSTQAQSAPICTDLHVMLLLQLLDLDEPMEDGKKYYKLLEEFIDFGLLGVHDVYRMPLTHLATFGSLGMDSAKHIHAYIARNILPLIDPSQDTRGETSKAAAASKDEEISEANIEMLNGKGKEKMRDDCDWSSDEDQETLCGEEVNGEEVDELENDGDGKCKVGA